jgi:hypothetical protein
MILLSATSGLSSQEDEAASNQPKFPIRNASGIVVDHEGNPVPNAVLCYRSRRDGKRFNVIERTDKEGKYTIEYRQTYKFDSFHTWVFAKGHGVRTVNMGTKFKSKKGQARQTTVKDVEIRLPKDAPYEIEILDPNGNPLSDVQVHVSMANAPNGKFQSDVPTGLIDIVPVPFCRLLTSATDKKGKVILRGIPSNLASRIAVTSAEFGIQNLNFRDDKQYQLLDVGSVSGSINAEDVTPYVGMKIYMQAWSRDGGYAEAIVDSEGKFEVPAMAHGELTIDVGWPDGADIYPWSDTNTTVKAGEELRLDTVTNPSKFVTVTGKVLTSDTRKPAAKVTISFQDDRGRSGTSVESNAKGEYEAKVCEGDASWQVISMGSFNLNYNYPRPVQFTFNIPDGTKEMELDPILLPVKPTVRGKLTDSNDQPIVDSNVVIYRGVYGHTRGSATTDSDGKFEMKVSQGWENALTDQGRNFYFAIKTKAASDTLLPNFERLKVLDKRKENLHLQRLAPQPAEKPADKNRDPADK